MNHSTVVEITYKNMRFLITHSPTNATLNKFTEELNKYGITTEYYEDVVQFIRQKHHRTFNSKQLLYLEKYLLQCSYTSNTHMITETPVAFSKATEIGHRTRSKLYAY
uniref:Uncharacterized protein n=1 Tax=Vombatus ursinus TaxID=29139 RepID=A0A4X2L6L4_VOMUR